MSEYVHLSQLYCKHGGLNPDPQEYWPPQIPGVRQLKSCEEETIYYSIEHNESFFGNSFGDQPNEGKDGCCDNACTDTGVCRIF
jgi:hypothetical protein